MDLFLKDASRIIECAATLFKDASRNILKDFLKNVFSPIDCEVLVRRPSHPKSSHHPSLSEGLLLHGSSSCVPLQGFLTGTPCKEKASLRLF